MKGCVLAVSLLTAIASAAPGVAAAQQIQSNPDPKSQIPAQRNEATVREGFTLVALGDLIMSNPVLNQVDAGFRRVLDILAGGDVVLANQEVPIFDQKRLQLAPGHGGLLIGHHSVAPDLKAMGIDLVSVANNHAVDWGLQGLTETIGTLESAGVPTAGGGANRTEARAPVYLDTPKGRIGVVATASTFNAPSLAADASLESPARPGISVVRTQRAAKVSPEEMAVLRGIAARYRSSAGAAGGDSSTLNLLGQTYVEQEGQGFTYRMNPVDHFEVLKGVRAARQRADLVVLSIHAHESLTGGDESPIPGDFLPELFHDAIDTGADVVINHGSHAIRGIEIYKGRPIFYGVGTFVFQALVPVTQDWLEATGLDPRLATPGDVREVMFRGSPAEWNDSILPIVEYAAGGQAKQVTIFPLDLNPVAPNITKGIPRLATGKNAERILRTLQALSAEYGTEVEIKGGVAVVRL